MTLTPARIAELLEDGVVLAHLDLLHEMEKQSSPLVSLRARREDDGTWTLLATRVYDCPSCGAHLPDNPMAAP